MIDKNRFTAMLRQAADLWLENVAVLSGIDSKFGDGDHGVTIGKIARLFHQRLDSWGDESFGDFLEALGDGVMALSGGSAGPLYGALLGGLAGAGAEADTNEGAHGVDMGRNIFQAESPAAMCQAVAKVVHEKFKAREAFQFYRDRIGSANKKGK